MAPHHVSLGNPGARDHNTLSLWRRTLVVPLERDLDGDPLQDDEVRLVRADGHDARVLRVGEPRVEPSPDGTRLLYRFDDVPFGVYRVDVRVAGRWLPVVPEITVRRRGVYAGEQRLDGALDDAPAAEENSPAVATDDDDDDDELDLPAENGHLDVPSREAP